MLKIAQSTLFKNRYHRLGELTIIHAIKSIQ